MIEQHITTDSATANDDVRIAIDMPEGQTMYLSTRVDLISALIENIVSAAMKISSDPKLKNDPKSLAMRASLNAVLIAVGPMITKMFWRGIGEAPKPPRKADLMEFYIRFVADTIISALRHNKTMIRLISTHVEKLDETHATVHIGGVHAQPAPIQTER